MGSGADRLNKICIKSPDNKHDYQVDKSRRNVSCVYCGDVLTTMAGQVAKPGSSPERCNLNPDSTSHVFKNSVCIYCNKEGLKRGKVADILTNDMQINPSFDDMTVIGLMGAFEMYGSLLVLQMKVDGMKAANTVCTMAGHYPDYREQEFKKMANNAELIVQRLNAMKRVQGFK